MPSYMYKAREETGKLVTGTMDAVSEDALAKQLQSKGYILTSVNQFQEKADVMPVRFGSQKVKVMEMVFFSFQLSNMLDAGVPILTSLQTISRQVKNKQFKQVIIEITDLISSGSSFSEALAQYPKVFPPLFINMVNSGEVSGTLSQTLSRYAIYIEHQDEIRQKIKNAIFYPTILLVVSLVVIMIIVSFVIPKFMEIFTRANVDIPLPTLILHSIGIGIRKYWYLFIFSIAAIVFSIKLYIATPKGKYQFDGFKLIIPLAGDLIYKTVISRFCRTLSTLLRSGVSMIYSLNITRDNVGNEVIAKVVNDTRISVEEGETVTEPLLKSGKFPLDVVQMVSVGEQTGKLHEMLEKVADFYDRSIEHSIKRLLTLIEPALIIIMGGLAGFIMASLLLPLFDMVKTIQR